jgi:hypothetical protein
LLDDFSERLINGGKAEVEAFVVLRDSGESIEVEEDFDEFAKEIGDSQLNDDLVPLADSFVEDSHDGQEVVRFLRVVVEAE